jgi:hypothetical protein
MKLKEQQLLLLRIAAIEKKISGSSVSTEPVVKTEPVVTVEPIVEPEKEKPAVEPQVNVIDTFEEDYEKAKNEFEAAKNASEQAKKDKRDLNKTIKETTEKIEALRNQELESRRWQASSKQTFDALDIQSKINSLLSNIKGINLNKLKVSGVGSTFKIEGNISYDATLVTVKIDLSAKIENDTRNGGITLAEITATADKFQDRVNKTIKEKLGDVVPELLTYLTKNHAEGKAIDNIWIEDGKLKIHTADTARPFPTKQVSWNVFEDGEDLHRAEMALKEYTEKLETVNQELKNSEAILTEKRETLDTFEQQKNTREKPADYSKIFENIFEDNGKFSYITSTGSKETEDTRDALEERIRSFHEDPEIVQQRIKNGVYVESINQGRQSKEKIIEVINTLGLSVSEEIKNAKGPEQKKPEENASEKTITTEEKISLESVNSFLSEKVQPLMAEMPFEWDGASFNDSSDGLEICIDFKLPDGEFRFLYLPVAFKNGELVIETEKHNSPDEETTAAFETAQQEGKIDVEKIKELGKELTTEIQKLAFGTIIDLKLSEEEENILFVTTAKNKADLEQKMEREIAQAEKSTEKTGETIPGREFKATIGTYEVYGSSEEDITKKIKEGYVGILNLLEPGAPKPKEPVFQWPPNELLKTENKPSEEEIVSEPETSEASHEQQEVLRTRAELAASILKEKLPNEKIKNVFTGGFNQDTNSFALTFKFGTQNTPIEGVVMMPTKENPMFRFRVTSKEAGSSGIFAKASKLFGGETLSDTLSREVSTRINSLTELDVIPRSG